MGNEPDLRIFILQPSSGVPIYLQLIQQVRRMVASGQLTPGTELPSVREVATEYTVNPTTISKAYSLLENEGLLQRNRGKPMTVSRRPARRGLPGAAPAARSNPRSTHWCWRRGSWSCAPPNCVNSSTKKMGEEPVSESLLTTHGLGKTIGRKTILHDISVTVAPGSVVGIIGKNGAGKTTLLEILLGFSPATAGNAPAVRP